MSENFYQLKDPSVFDGLSAPKTYAKGQLIYQQGDDAECVYYLRRGTVQIYISAPSGAEKTLVVFSEGNLFGKSSFFDQMPRSSCAKALAMCEIDHIDRRMMTEIISRHPQFALDMLEYLSKTIRMFSDQINDLTFLQADRQIARFIAENARGGELSLTHEEISRAVGVSRVTVSKILSRFARDGYIATRYKSIKILNPDALNEFAFNDNTI